jgi:hypothetical protein
MTDVTEHRAATQAELDMALFHRISLIYFCAGTGFGVIIMSIAWLLS